MHDEIRLTLQCDDQPGIVTRITKQILASGGNVVDAHQFSDPSNNRFFMRVAMHFEDTAAGQNALEKRLKSDDSLSVDWSLTPAARRKRVLIMVSKFDHCLIDLLYRRQIGELDMDIAGIASNHPRSALNFLLPNEISFYHLPVTPETKDKQETALGELIETSEADLVVLARYMQILSNDLAGDLHGRCINIHHSFLPGFKGARPYHQAFQRGVKIIGATAHFVTPDLDEGPIIAQDVEEITHADSPQSLIRKGRDIERRVLSRAVGYFLDDRILLNGTKTVVFRD